MNGWDTPEDGKVIVHTSYTNARITRYHEYYCPRVTKNAKEKDRDVIPQDATLCRVCSGEYDRSAVEQKPSLEQMIQRGEVEI